MFVALNLVHIHNKVCIFLHSIPVHKYQINIPNVKNDPLRCSYNFFLQVLENKNGLQFIHINIKQKQLIVTVAVCVIATSDIDILNLRFYASLVFLMLPSRKIASWRDRYILIYIRVSFPSQLLRWHFW
jgi:hypothetical protein